jgi:hypothetical protein
MDEVIEKAKADLAQVNIPALKAIDVTFVSARKKTFTVSAENSAEFGPKPINATFPEPVLLQRLTFTVADSASGTIYVDIVDLNTNSTVTHRLALSANAATLSAINVLTTGFALRTERGFLKTHRQKLIKVDAFGYLEEEIEQACNAVAQASAIKVNCQALIDKIQADKVALVQSEAQAKLTLEQLSNSTREKSAEKAILEKALADQQAALDALEHETEQERKSLNEIQEKFKEAKSGVQDLEGKLEERQIEIQTKTREVSELNSERQRLYSDKSLFTENLQGYSQQCDRDTKFFTLLIVTPIFALIVLCGYLLYNATSLQETLAKFPNRSAWELLVTRTPQASIVMFMVTAFGALAHLGIGEIREIKARRRRIGEISCSVQDVASSATKVFGLSDDEQLKLLISLKMSILRDFFSGKLDANPAEKMVQEVLPLPKQLATNAPPAEHKEPSGLDH